MEGTSLGVDPFDERIRLFVYQTVMATGRIPSPLVVARTFDISILDASQSFQRLERDHDALVLLPGSSYIWMAEPFSGVPTDYPVVSGESTWFGNCVWDALAIASLLGTDAEISTACPVSRTELRLRVQAGKLVEGPGVVHFAVKASDWWRSIGFT